MDEKNKTLKNMIISLSSTNVEEVYQSLKSMRQQLLKNKTKVKLLAHDSLVKLLISCLKQPKLCHASLGLVADCCMDPCFCEVFVSSGGIAPLITIVRSILADEIVNTACRALGNIAMSERGLAALHEDCPVLDITKFLSSTGNANYKKNAVRTLRVIGRNPKGLQILINADAFVSVSELLVLDDLEVLKAAVKTMDCLTRECNKASKNIFDQLKRGAAVAAFQNLYDHDDKEISEHAMQSLANLLCPSSIAAGLVIDVATVKVFFDAAGKKLSQKNVRTAVMALCFCCHIAYLTYNIRQLGGVQLLTGILKNKDYRDLHSHILRALTFLCCLEQNSDLFCEVGIIPLLMANLKAFIEANKTHSSAKYVDSCQELTNSASVSRSGSLRVPKGDGSCCISSKTLSNADVQDKSPLLKSSKIHCEKRSGTKAFVEQESGILDVILRQQSPANTVVKSDAKKRRMLDSRVRNNGISNSVIQNEYLMDSSQKQKDQEKVVGTREKSIDHFILSLLCHLFQCVRDMSSSKLLVGIDFSVLLEYAMLLAVPNPKIFDLFKILIGNHYAFEKLILYDFFGKMDRMCQSLKGYRQDLMPYGARVILEAGNAMAESDFGIGVLQHVLATSKTHNKLYCLYASAKLVKKKKCLHKILIEAHGLSFIFQCLSNEDGSSFESSAAILSAFSSTFENSKKNCEGRVETCIGSDVCCVYESVECDTEFCLDDGEKVCAASNVLTSKSEYFFGLLKGCYAESMQKCVNIPHVSSNVFKFIVHYLHGCKKDMCPVMKSISLYDAIELIVASERFMIVGAKTIAEQFTMGHIDMKHAFDIYTVAKLHNSPTVARFALNYILVHGMSEKAFYISSLKTLLQSDSHEVFQEIEYLVKEFLFSHVH